MADITQLLKTVAFPSISKRSAQGQSTSAFSVENVKQAIYKYNISRTNLGEVRIPVPPLLFQRKPNYSNFVPLISLYTESFIIPSMGMATSEARRYGEGPTTKQAYLPLNADLTFSIICDGRGIIHSFFYNWMKTMVRANDRNLSGDTTEYSFPFEVSYFKDYAVDIDLYVYDEKSDRVMISTIYNAFPVFASELQYNWNSNNDLARMNITMTYEYYDNIYYEGNFDDPVPEKKDNLSTLQSIVKAATAVQTLSTLRKPKSIGDVLNITNNSANIIKAF